MLGNPALSVLAAAYAKGIRSYDVEEACRYAGTPDAEENEEAEPTLEDDTPAGQWVRGVRKVYENITTAFMRGEIDSMRFSFPCR